MTVITGQRETEASFFPADQNILSNPAPQKITSTAKGFTLELKKDADLKQPPAELSGVLELSGGRAYEIAAKQGPPTPPSPPNSASPANSANFANPANSANSAISANSASSGALRIIGLAFLGGIILNLMPCVFPVLFLKGLALVNSGREERHKLRMHGLVYAAGILVSFWALVGVLLGLRSAGARLGWGFQFQSPMFLFLMAGLLFFLGLSLAGQFEIGLTLTSAGGSLAAEAGLRGQLLHRRTGSHRGHAVHRAVHGRRHRLCAHGACAGHLRRLHRAGPGPGRALRRAHAAARLDPHPAPPRRLDGNPAPGRLAAHLRLRHLAGVGHRRASYGSTMLAALLAGFLLLAIAGWFLGRWPAKRLVRRAGRAHHPVFRSARSLLKAGAGRFLPPRFLPLPAHNPGEWQPWSDAAVKQYQSQGRPVFVDFTAKWCLSCQVNERVALTRPEVMKAFEDAHVALLKADWTQQDPAIAQALESLGRNGVPAYALYPPGQGSPTLLPEALTPGIVIDAVHNLPQTAPSAAASGRP